MDLKKILVLVYLFSSNQSFLISDGKVTNIIRTFAKNDKNKLDLQYTGIKWQNKKLKCEIN